MPARLELEGPSDQGLKVRFYAPSGELSIEGALRIGVDFTCEGEWIVETQGKHRSDYVTTSYARDEEGRLIGFKGSYSVFAGMVDVFGVNLPLAGISLDKVWWRVEPER